MEISAQQLAELLLGIARAQAAMIQGLENEMAGVRSGRIIPALQNVAHLRDHPNPTLTDLPVRVLLERWGARCRMLPAWCATSSACSKRQH